MATFKVGDRARFVRFGVDAINNDPRLIGAEVVVVEVNNGLGWDYTISAPFASHAPSRLPPNHFGCDASELAPLTDSGADAFIASIKRLKPYEEPKKRGNRLLTPAEFDRRLREMFGGSQ